MSSTYAITRSIHPDHSSPGHRTGALMVYDAARRHVLLFGGARQAVSGGIVEYPDDLWAWNGETWREIEIPAGAVRPPGRDVPQLVYDAAREVVLMFGGRRDEWLSDMWEWDGKSWQKIATPGLSRVLHPTTTFDPVHRHVLMYGGGYVDSSGGFAGFSRKLWVWTDAQWVLRDSVGPENRYPGASAVLPGGELVLMTTEGGPGNNTGPPPASRTWIWSGSSWSARETGPSFNNLQATASAPDGTLYFYQSWENWLTSPITHVRSPGGEWRQVSTSTTPGIRYTMAAAWDADRRRLVVYGGTTRDGTYLDDTWEFDGQQWVKR